MSQQIKRQRTLSPEYHDMKMTTNDNEQKPYNVKQPVRTATAFIMLCLVKNAALVIQVYTM